VLHKVCVTQVYKTTRKIVMKVEAENIENAIELVASGGIDLPEFNHPDWLTGWQLENEEVTDETV
jgi:hypothetical protein